jgi:hypothetical protein
MATWRDVGVNYGGQHIGKAVSRGLKALDGYLGKAGAPVEKRPSTWITIVGAVGLPAAVVLLKVRDPWDKLAILLGGFLSTNLWDIAEEAMAAAGGGAAAAVRSSPAPVYTPPATPQVQSSGERIY